MKNLRTSVLCTCFSLFSICSFAQEHKAPLNEPDLNKPHLFDQLPAKISFNPENLISLAGKPAGNTVSFSLSDDAKISFEGKMIASSVKNNGKLQTVSVQSTNFNGATFYLSKVILEDGSIRYNGRLMSFKHGDLFVLQKNISGQYELVKKNFYDLVNE